VIRANVADVADVADVGRGAKEENREEKTMIAENTNLTPEELLADLRRRGIAISAGGSLLFRLGNPIPKELSPLVGRHYWALVKLLKQEQARYRRLRRQGWPRPGDAVMVPGQGQETVLYRLDNLVITESGLVVKLTTLWDAYGLDL